MSCAKGFSLLEVLLSLLLVSACVFSLLEQQRQGKQLMTKILVKVAHSSHLIKKSECSLLKEYRL